MNEFDEKFQAELANWHPPEEPVKKVAASEKFQSRNFIQEATLAETLEQLKEIDPEKRKIIIYVGVHPNEGTDGLTRAYADSWAEKYGATVVCQPTEETVHAIWDKRKPKNPDDSIEQLQPDKILDQEAYADKFSFDNKDTLVVCFHGTPLEPFNKNNRNRNRPERRRGLLIETSRYSKHPEDFKNRRHPILFSKPGIAEGLDKVIDSSEHDGVKNEVREEVFQDDSRWYPNSPNTLLVEYFYSGKPVKIEDPYIQKLVEMEEADYEKIGDDYPNNLPNVQLSLLSNQTWDRQMNIGPSYLTQDTLSDEDIQVFNNVLVKDFEKILKHISEQLPINGVE